MAPIKNIVTSALVLTIAVAAPVQLDRKSHAIADPPTGTHSKHHSEPMHKVASSIAGLPSGTFDAKAMQSSALAAAVANAQPSQSADDGVFDIFNHLPLRKERRQFEMLTRILTDLNQVAKRDTVARRQLGAIKSAPEALNQLAHVAALAESLPVRRGAKDESADLGEIKDNLDGFGKRDGAGFDFHDIGVTRKFLGRLGKRDAEDLTERGSPLDLITNALGGLAKRGSEDLTERGSPLDLLTNALGGLAKRDAEDLTERGSPLDLLTNALGGLAKRDAEDLTERGSPLDLLTNALGGLAKRDTEDLTERGSPLDLLTNALGGLAKRDAEDLTERGSPLDLLTNALGGLAKRDTEDLTERGSPLDLLTNALGGLAKRDAEDLTERGSPLDLLTNALGGLAKRESEVKATEHQDYVKHKDALLKNLLAMKDNDDQVEHTQFQSTTQSEEPGVGDPVEKRQSGAGLGGLGGLGGLLNGLARRDYPASADDTSEKRDNNGGIGPVNAITKALGGLAKRENMSLENVKRQLGGLATGVLSNVGPVVTRMGKMVTGKARRSDLANGQAGASTPSANKDKDTSTNDDMIGSENAAEKIAAAVKVAGEATQNIGSPSNMGPAKGPLGKRQVPPIAGGDLPTVVQALASNPSIITAPLTKGVKLGGTSLGNVLPM